MGTDHPEATNEDDLENLKRQNNELRAQVSTQKITIRNLIKLLAKLRIHSKNQDNLLAELKAHADELISQNEGAAAELKAHTDQLNDHIDKLKAEANKLRVEIIRSQKGPTTN